MPALFTILFKINIALVLFCLGYYLVLRHLTFYTLNRLYLVAAILFSSVYPWINLSDFVQRHQQLAKPVETVILQWKTPAENLVKPLNQPNYWNWAEAIFWAGAALLAIRLGMQLYSLYRLYRNSKPGQVHNYDVRLVDGDVSPFSFWRSIFVNPDTLSPADLEKVLEHEQVHVSQWHTLDILLAELSTVFYWFNPGIWLMKKAVRENVEFITDRKILQKGADSKEYQYSLLNVSMAGAPNNLVNNFNISTIKKRIIMMNAKRSSRIKLTRYLILAPVVVALLLVFTISKAEVAKKSLSTFHAITSVITGDNLVNDLHAELIAEKKVKTKHVLPKEKAKSCPADTIYSGRSKDGKKDMLLVSDKSTDSIIYVLNGAKSTKEQVKAIDPAKVKSLDMLTAADAKQFVDFTIDKPQLLFVTTDDSEAGKKLKDRIDKSMGSGALASLNKAHAMAYSINSPDAAPVTVVGTGSSYAISSDNVAVASGSNVNLSYKANDVIVVGNSPKPVKDVIITKGVVITGKPVTVVGFSKNSDVVAVNDMVNEVKISPDVNVKPHIYIKALPDRSSDVLFVVDGKEVKDLKSVVKTDIKSVTVLTDKDATSKYGEKGKNGVVVIKTKKGK